MAATSLTAAPLGSPDSPEKTIAKSEYTLLIIASAERRSQGNEPSPADITAAQAEVDAGLARGGISVRGGKEIVAKLLDKAKREAATSRAQVISGLCLGEAPNTPYYWSAAPGAPAPSSSARAATPEDKTLLKALRGWHAAEHRRSESTSTSGSVSAIGSFWDGLKSAAITAVKAVPNALSNPTVKKVLPIAAPIAALAALSPTIIKAVRGQGAKGKATSSAAPGPSSPDATSASTLPVKSDESEAAEAAGGPEYEAYSRGENVRGTYPYYFPTFIRGVQIPHEVYRAAVVQHAQKIARTSGSGKVTTKDMFRAEKRVQNGLAMKGISVAIPGARPGRRTV